MFALAAGIAVVFGAKQLDVCPVRAAVIVDLLAQVGGLAGPCAAGLQQQRVALTIGVFRVAMVNDKVRRDA